MSAQYISKIKILELENERLTKEIELYEKKVSILKGYSAKKVKGVVDRMTAYENETSYRKAVTHARDKFESNKSRCGKTSLYQMYFEDSENVVTCKVCIKMLLSVKGFIE